ncbi:hypothetical protein GC163_24580 [bacterium]|nr:hypothetical protein [bacterium]
MAVKQTVGTKQLLAQCAALINRHGPDAAEVTEFIEQNKADKEFVELAKLSQKLKKALAAVPAGTVNP